MSVVCVLPGAVLGSEMLSTQWNEDGSSWEGGAVLKTPVQMRKFNPRSHSKDSWNQHPSSLALSSVLRAGDGRKAILLWAQR